MKPISFPEANKNLLKPKGWTDEQCGSLPVRTDGQRCISCWKMDWGERLRALLFGRVWVFVHSGQTQPPISLGIWRSAFLKQKNHIATSEPLGEGT